MVGAQTQDTDCTWDRTKKNKEENNREKTFPSSWILTKRLLPSGAILACPTGAADGSDPVKDREPMIKASRFFSLSIFLFFCMFSMGGLKHIRE